MTHIITGSPALLSLIDKEMIYKVKLLILLTFLVMTQSSFAQNKQDYYWPFGKDWDLDKPGVQAIEIDFNERPLKASIREGELYFDQNNASICDEEGNLLLYTNGCAVANRDHQIMPNGDSINRGFFFDEWWGGDCSKAYPGGQDITILQDPGNGEGYYIIHKPVSYHPDSSSRFSRDSLHFTYVDLSLDDNNGDVVAKNQNFFFGDMLFSYLTGIAHANGQDWWILNPMRAGGYATFHLDEDGIHDSGTQQQQVTYSVNNSASGNARFSPDGTRYAHYNHWDGLHLFDFDRETGALSNWDHLPSSATWDDASTWSSVEWSASSRFLYMVTSDSIWQLDTYAEPLSSGVELIQVKAPDVGGGFFQIAALGPDCRIYIRAKSSKLYFHVIHKPDEPGIACDFQHDAIALPFYSAAGSFPNFPASV